MSTNLLAYRTRPAQREPEGALILLHGRGADEHDLEPVADMLDHGRRLVVFLPRGPLALPPGGAHWYAVRRVGYPDPATFLPTFERLAFWLDAVLVDAGVPIERAVVGGFSQGAVMSYSLALAAGRPRPAGIIAMSGFIPRVEGFDLALEDRAGLPAFISHGTNDSVIGVQWGQTARDRLAAARLHVTYREDPVEHTISPAALAEAQRFLAGIYARQ